MIASRSKPRPGRLKGKELIALRNACFDRDKGICQECRVWTNSDLYHQHPHSAHMAHIKAKRIGGDSLDNVRTLCGDCHRKEHAYGKEMVKPCPPKSPNL